MAEPGMNTPAQQENIRRSHAKIERAKNAQNPDELKSALTNHFWILALIKRAHDEHWERSGKQPPPAPLEYRLHNLRFELEHWSLVQHFRNMKLMPLSDEIARRISDIQAKIRRLGDGDGGGDGDGMMMRVMRSGQRRR